MIDDAQLVAECLLFRSGFLEGERSDGHCFLLSDALRKHLATMGIESEMVFGEIDIEETCWCSHVWLRLADGRVLDPTADQFSLPLNHNLPAVYLGEPHPEVHREKGRFTDEIQLIELMRQPRMGHP